MVVPYHFKQTILRLWPHEGQVWLNLLEQKIARLSQEWDLSQLKILEPLNFNFLARAQQHNRSVVVKIGIDKNLLFSEYNTLFSYGADGAVGVYDFNEVEGALLLEFLEPGTTLAMQSSVLQEQANHIFVELVKRLHKPLIGAEEQFIKIDDLVKDLERSKLPSIEYSLINQARHLADTLLGSHINKVLLHGDLHHGNILQSQRGWLAIDPKGIIGEPACEIAAFIRNGIAKELSWKEKTEIIVSRTASRISHLKLDCERVIRWNFVLTVVAASWAFEDDLP